MTTASHAYRSEYEHVIGTRLAEIRESRELVRPYLTKMRVQKRERIARLLAGGVGLFGAAFTVLVAALTNVRAELTYSLIGSFGAIFATYFAVRIVLAFTGRMFFDRRSEAAEERHRTQLSGNLHADLQLLASDEPCHRLEKKLAPLEIWSTALPLGALSLLTPLTLHYAFMSLLEPHESASSFAEWIRISFVIVGHAHIALLVMAIRFAKLLRRSSSAEIENISANREWLKAWAVTIGVSCLPFILLFAVPPILVAITGIVFVPLMFILMRARVLSERKLVETMSDVSSGRVAQEQHPVPLFGEGTRWTDLMQSQQQPQYVRVAQQEPRQTQEPALTPSDAREEVAVEVEEHQHHRQQFSSHVT